MRIAPASRSRAATVASFSGTKFALPSVPPVVMMPSVSMESFRVKGTPCSEPRLSPRARDSSAFLASERALSVAICTTAFSTGLTSSIRARCASKTSVADTFLSLMSWAMLLADW